MQEAIAKGFRLSMADSKCLKDGIDVISGLITEANVNVKPEGLEIVAMDPANVSMVIFRVRNAAFTEYNVHEEQTMGISLSSIKQILKRLKSDDILSLELGENRLNISAIGNLSKSFSLPLIALEKKEQRIPELKFSATKSVQCSHLSGYFSELLHFLRCSL